MLRRNSSLSFQHTVIKGGGGGGGGLFTDVRIYVYIYMYIYLYTLYICVCAYACKHINYWYKGKIALELLSKNAQLEKMSGQYKHAIRRCYGQISQNSRLVTEMKLLKQSVQVLKTQLEVAKRKETSAQFAPLSNWTSRSKHFVTLTVPSLPNSRANCLHLSSSSTLQAKDLMAAIHEEDSEYEHEKRNDKESESDDEIDSLLQIEKQFKTMVKQESMLQLDEEKQNDLWMEEVQNELNDLRSQVEAKDAQIQKLKLELDSWTNSHDSVWT
ncbi:hypothetical protein RFI_30599, partial [Reticulomyxa filosa]